MISAQWIRRRQQHWARLEDLIARCGSTGVSVLSHEELQELALLYRQTGADLSTARDDPASAALAGRLNDLLGRAHNLLYTAYRDESHSIWRFYTRRFPQVFRECWRETALAVALFAIFGLVGWALTSRVAGFARFVLGPEMIDTIERGQMWTHSILAMKPVAATGIMTNNLAVSFTAFATGIFGGLGTAYLIAFNGLLIGVVAAACHQGGLSLQLWSFVAPHGSLELPAIFIAGGAGFVLARGVLMPGLLARSDALARAGRQSVQLLMGVIPLLVIAGLVEGFVSPTPMAVGLKWLVGAGLFILLVLYLTLAGREAHGT
jgi:uncharacterized membrane protein SpoIIM required for sporulation